jgi:hypothetical protein
MGSVDEDALSIRVAGIIPAKSADGIQIAARTFGST